MHLGWAERRYLERLAAHVEAQRRQAESIARLAELNATTVLLRRCALFRRRRVN